MKNHLLAYRVMANVVGVLLIVLILVGMPLKYAHLLNDGWLAEGTDAQELGAWITTNLGVAHGWLYMIFLFAAFALARRAKWDIPFAVTTLLCGTVPVLSFWSERRASRKVLAEYPEAAGLSPTS